jgi:hypothetical protein
MAVIPSISFEVFLQSKRYEPFMYDYNQKKVVHAKGDYPSSMDLVSIQWKLSADHPKGFSTGLNEKGMPPTLIHPRPIIQDNKTRSTICRDFSMARIFAKFTNEEIYDSIINAKPLIVNDINEITKE